MEIIRYPPWDGVGEIPTGFAGTCKKDLTENSGSYLHGCSSEPASFISLNSGKKERTSRSSFFSPSRTSRPTDSL